MKNDEEKRERIKERAKSATGVEREERREENDRGGSARRETDEKGENETGKGIQGTAKTVADWRPQARLRILGVMPVIRGFGAQ
ncbi:hypothetical protein EAG_14902 [Camponotus floridanus]|uniref:Uncharacterized protein n=1 Tax=Camponotus floridanus TaxID=104421 RepID=E2B0X6_CAMFO|nr:hypothetical protein EAG_14902 [Camponotus floridanus]